eukprot:3641799-Rhodomonas_salina.2
MLARRNQRNCTAFPVHFVPREWVLAIDFAAAASDQHGHRNTIRFACCKLTRPRSLYIVLNASGCTPRRVGTGHGVAGA